MNNQIIKETIFQDIKLKLQASFFMLLDNSIILKDNLSWQLPYEKPSNFKNIEDTVIKITNDLKDILEKPIDSRDSYISHLSKIKTEIINIAESLYCYYAYNNQLKKIIDNYEHIIYIQEEKIANIDINAFFKDCMDFVSKDNNPFDESTNISTLMSCFPIKMTKEKYQEYVKKSLDSLFIDASQNFIDEILRSFKLKISPTNMPEYGKYFLEIKDKLETIAKLDLENLKLDELEELYNTLDDNFEIIAEIEDYLSILLECVNYQICIITFTDDIDYIIDNNLIYKDIFYTSKNILSEELENDLKERLKDLLNNTCEEIIDEIIPIEKNKNSLLKNINVEDLDFKEILEVDNIINNLYYKTITDLVFPIDLVNEKENTKLEKNLIDNKIGEFLSFLQTSISQLPISRQKLIKQFFLENIPSGFSKDEFYKYIVYIFDTTKDFYKRAIILENVGNIFLNLGFIEPPIDDHDNCCEKHHHSHDHEDCCCDEVHHNHEHNDCCCEKHHHH